MKGRAGITGSGTTGSSAWEDGAVERVEEVDAERSRVTGPVTGVAVVPVAGVVGAPAIDLFLERFALVPTFSLPLALEFAVVFGAELGLAAAASAFAGRRSA